MIENVITISNRKSGLAKTPEYWQNADFGAKSEEVIRKVTEKMGFVPRASMKIIREVSFLVKASTTIVQLKHLSGLLKEKFKIDCFQISIDREESMAHMLFVWVDEGGKPLR